MSACVGGGWGKGCARVRACVWVRGFTTHLQSPGAQERSEFRSCVKVEVAVVAGLSVLMSLTVSVDV